MSNKLVLVDGHSIMNRAFYGLPEMTNSKGEHTNAVLGFLNIFLKLLEEEKATHVVVAFDVKQPTFRHLKYKEYKGTRKPMPDALHEQVAYMKDMLKAMDVTVIEKGGYEADDILGTLSVKAQEKGYEVTILSGDRDLLQLATDKVCIRMPKTKNHSTVIEKYYDKDVKELYELTTKQFIDLKALMGDTADNIPGVPGIGEKTGIKILKQFETLEKAYENIDQVKPNKARENMITYKEQAFLSKDLATIKLDCELNIDIDNTNIGDVFTKEAYDLCKRFELKSLYKNFSLDEKQRNDILISYEVVDDLNQCDAIFQNIKTKKKCGFAFVGDKEFKGIAIGFEEEWYFIKPGFLLLKDYIFQKVEEILMDSSILVCMMDAKEEYSHFEKMLDEAVNIFDVGIAAYLLNPLRNAYSVEEIASEYGIGIQAWEEMFGKMEFCKAYEQDEEKVIRYYVAKAMIATKVSDDLKEKLEQQGMWYLYEQIELPTMYVLYEMQQYGIHTDKEALKNYGEQLTGRIEELEQLIWQRAGHEFNILSPKQLGIVLFEELHLPGAKKTKTGFSTSAEVLEGIRNEDPIVDEVLEYRQLTKLKSTYAEGLANYISEDQRIHGIFHQTVTATGRISSTEPNLQNIPMKLPLGRKIREVFLPKEGCEFVDADYSQIELRVLAELSQDETLLEAYKEGLDIHAVTASKVFHVPVDEVTSLQRRNAKAVNFGIVYGISAFGLSKDLKISRKQAESYINDYFETYPKIKEFLDREVDKAKKDGFVRTLFGRIRPIPELSSSNFMQRSFGERVAMNSPIQGTAADIIKLAMVRVSRRLRKENLKSRMILQIHDELLIETAKEEEEQVKKILEEEMVHAVDFSIPMEIDMSVGDNWYEAK